MGVRLMLELTRSSDGRIEGEITSGNGQSVHAFSGVLELLKVLEDLGPSRHLPGDDPGPENGASVDSNPR